MNNKYHGNHVRKTGGQPSFTKKEELALIKGITTCADWGFPFTTIELQMFTKHFMESAGVVISKFKNNTPGPDWVKCFLIRHQNLIGKRLTQNINKARAGVSSETISEYFSNLHSTLQDIPPSNIFNYDETNVSDDPGRKKMIFRRGVKYPEKVINHSKTAISLMMCGSASGVLLPPYVIYKSEGIMDPWRQNGPKGFPCCNDPCCSRGTRYNRTSHGWIDAVTFSEWFRSTFLPHAYRLPGRKLLIGDNLSSHFTPDVLKACEENDIAFVCFPPNSTHLCQPLDVCFFRPFKESWRNVIYNYKMTNKNAKSIPKCDFPTLLKKCLNNMNVDKKTNTYEQIKNNLVSGFKATGIVPFNPDSVLRKLPDYNDDHSKEVADNLITFLKEQRFSHATQVIRRKNKRLRVAPGVSVTANDSEEEVTEEATGVVDNADAVIIESDDISNKPVYESINIGNYLLVKVKSSRLKCIIYKYAVFVVKKMGKNELKVNGLKSMDSNHSTFKFIENDVFIIRFNDVISLLPEPQVITIRGRTKYQFPSCVDVLEA